MARHPRAVLSSAPNPDRSSRRCAVAVSAETDTRPAPGRLELRAEPPGLPNVELDPPVVAESGDPFTALRVTHLVARIERGRPVLIADVAARLDADHLDWLFPPRVVTDVILQLASNWMTDYRNVSGIVVEDSPYGPTVTIEDSSRVDPWIVGQVERTIAECRARLAEFSRRDRVAAG